MTVQSSRSGLEDALDDWPQGGDRDGDEHDLRAAQRRLERVGGLHGAALHGALERVRVLVPADRVAEPGALGGEPGRRADEPRPYDREPHEGLRRQTVLMSSATRNARSSDCCPFRRGSHRVS